MTNKIKALLFSAIAVVALASCGGGTGSWQYSLYQFDGYSRMGPDDDWYQKNCVTDGGEECTPGQVGDGILLHPEPIKSYKSAYRDTIYKTANDRQAYIDQVEQAYHQNHLTELSVQPDYEMLFAKHPNRSAFINNLSTGVYRLVECNNGFAVYQGDLTEQTEFIYKTYVLEPPL